MMGQKQLRAQTICALCGRRFPDHPDATYAVASFGGRGYISPQIPGASRRLQTVEERIAVPSIRIVFEDETSRHVAYVNLVKHGSDIAAWLVGARCYQMLQAMSKVPVTPDALLQTCLVLQADKVDYFPREENRHELPCFDTFRRIREGQPLRTISLDREYSQECRLCTLPAEILLLIVRWLPSNDAVSFLSSCKKLLKLAPLFWEPLLRYLPSPMGQSQDVDLISLTLRLYHLSQVPGPLQTWGLQLDELRSFLVDLKSAAHVMSAVANKAPDTFSGFRNISGCRSFPAQWPDRARKLKVFYQYIQGKAYVSGIQFVSNTQHEVVGYESTLYNCIPVSSKKRILRFVVDELGIRSLSCSDDPSSGWSCGKPQAIGCWEGFKTYDRNCQDCGGECDILVVMDAFKLRCVGHSHQKPDVLGENLALRPFLPSTSLLDEESFVQRQTNDHRAAMIAARGFFTADYVQFPPDMSGITVYLNRDARLSSMEIHSATAPQLLGVTSAHKSEDFFDGPYVFTKFGGAQHLAIHAPDEYITDITTRVLDQRVGSHLSGFDLGIEIRTNRDRHFLFGIGASERSSYIYKKHSLEENEQFDGMFFTRRFGMMIHGVGCAKRKITTTTQSSSSRSRRKTRTEALPVVVPAAPVVPPQPTTIRPPMGRLMSLAQGPESEFSHSRDIWDKYGTCARLSNVRHITWSNAGSAGPLVGISLFYRDCTSAHLGSTRGLCGRGFTLYDDEELKEVHIAWKKRPPQRNLVVGIEFTTSKGRYTGADCLENGRGGDCEVMEIKSVNSDSVAAWWSPMPPNDEDFFVFPIADAVISTD